MDSGRGWAVTNDEVEVGFKKIGAFAPELPPKEFLFDFDPVIRE